MADDLPTSMVWRAIPGYPGYCVTNMGQVLSCWSRGGRTAKMTKTWKRMAGDNCNGYRRVCLQRPDGKIYRVFVHVLVLEIFVGPRPPSMEACHGDGNRANCKLSNLYWGTKKQNAADKVRHGTMTTGSKQTNSKLTENQVREIRAARRRGESLAALAKRFGISKARVSQIVLRQSWNHI